LNPDCIFILTLEIQNFKQTKNKEMLKILKKGISPVPFRLVHSKHSFRQRCNGGDLDEGEQLLVILHSIECMLLMDQMLGETDGGDIGRR
jgi:RNA:NAD 2'-phosphotransferase (TPT1/KptA family)